MPLTGPRAEDTDIRMIAGHEKRISRLEQRTAGGGGSFDPNEDPILIGLLATAGGGSTPSSPGSGTPHDIVIGHGASTDGPGGTNNCQIAIGDGASAGDHPGGNDVNNTAVGCASTAGYLYSPATDGVENSAYGYTSEASGLRNTAVGSHASAIGPEGNTAVGCAAFALDSLTTTVAHATAVGWQAGAGHEHASAFGADSATTAANQVMLGSAADFVEIPGDSGTAPNGLVLTDTATGTRYIVQITSGALVLSAAP